MASIDDLPEEVLEFILSLIPPYNDLHLCMLVSKRWRRCVLNVARSKRRELLKSIANFNVCWTSTTPIDMEPAISKRYSHTAAVHENSMYVFGGCTCSMTTFNDLWRLDLSKRQWVRPLTMGHYPSPKACSSMVAYNNSLILFGGWTYPPSYPLYQSWHLFNELHVYDIVGNVWTDVTTIFTPPPMAGHSVSIVGEWMVVFGGLHKPIPAVQCERSNAIWKLNLNNRTWCQQEVEFGPKPNGRFGQTQIVLDENNLFIIGGSGGSNSNFGDAWVLNMHKEFLWRWIPIEVRGKHHRPTNIWSNPGCKVGDKIVVLNRINELNVPINRYGMKSGGLIHRRNVGQEGQLARIDLANRKTDRDENVNGKRGTLKYTKAKDDVNQLSPSQSAGKDSVVINNLPSSSISLSAFNGTNNSKTIKSEKLKERRLSYLEKYRDNMRKEPSVSEKVDKNHYLGIYVLDISHALDEKPYVTWLTPKQMRKGPEETILYTLVEGKSELIMFGGIQNDGRSLGTSLYLNNQISNSLHFITAPDYVI